MSASMRGTIYQWSISLYIAWISSYSGWCNKWQAGNGNPLGPCTWFISRTIWDRTNMSMAKMSASMRGTIYQWSISLYIAWISSYSGWCNKWLAGNGNPLGPCTWFISRTIEIEQICQWLKCAPRWEEQSINRLYHCISPGFQVIVADVTNGRRVMETPWDLVHDLSREPFEIEQICEWLKCAPRWDEQSINRVYHCKYPGSQVIVADVINCWRVMETPGTLYLNYLENHLR